MQNPNVAILKAVVCVAWADGLLKDTELRVLEGILAACHLTQEEAAEVRAYAASPRTLADLDIRGLSVENRRSVILHAVALANADNDYSFAERQTIVALCERLGLPMAEFQSLIGMANSRYSR